MRTERAEIKVGGMICRPCAEAVETALIQTRGVIDARVSYRRGTAEVDFDPELTDIDALRHGIERAGYMADRGGMSGTAVDIICLIAAAALTLLLVKLGGGTMGAGAGGAIGLGGAFLTGLMTSGHCAGMCGGILLSQTTDASDLAGAGKDRRNAVRASLAYNGGRALSYTALGGVFGALGSALSYSAQARAAIFVVAGLAVTLIGVQMSGALPGLRRLSPQQSALCALPLKARQAFVGKPLAIGLLTGLMPCGALYAMWACAAASGGFLRGAEIMLSFAFGTAPLLVLLGALNSFVPAKLTKYMLKLSAVLVCAMGAAMIVKGLRI